ncbi:5'-nucleotidase [Flavobacterium sp.]|uniref:5'-nucleotidase n=1 Tax=Flavobacterium sp. TaxID=239 RepID=UPI00286C0FD8|nr:5'-nucleotidase [Flavobacterium sp.]
MVKLKNYNVVLSYFVLFLTFLLSVSCRQQKLYVTKIEGKEIGITDKNKEVAAIEEFIKPYREHIDQDLSTILAVAPQTLDKNGEWQTPMGNMFSDAVMLKGNPVFMAREKKSIDIVLLNAGGVRSIIPQGNVTARTAFEIMPFENSLVVIGLKGEQIEEMLQYIITEKKPHPLSGMTFTIDKNNVAKDIMIQGKPFLRANIYYVGTNDYLANGGDNMNFFKKGVQKYDLDYKLRNILIDYFKDVDTIPMTTDTRITVEK